MAKKRFFSQGISKPISILTVAVVLLGTAGIVHATLLSGPDIISAPGVIADDTPGATNDHQQAFAEREAIILTEDVRCSNAIIPAGETVNSHMIFYNTQFQSPEVDTDRMWTFEGEVICVMAERSGLLQGLTDGMLGAPNTAYPGPFEGRGLETDGTDSYNISGKQLTLTMTAEEPGDWVRVLTKVSVPDDTQAPVVYCEVGTNPAGKTQENEGKGKGNDNDQFLTLIGADDTNGAVDLFLTDTETGTEFGPFEPGTKVQLTQAKGALPAQSDGAGSIDFKIKVKGETTISATDEAGNEASIVCSS